MGQLRDRMEQDLKLRGLSPCTQRNYLLYCRKFGLLAMGAVVEVDHLTRPATSGVGTCRHCHLSG
jgi:hypothetical protein